MLEVKDPLFDEVGDPLCPYQFLTQKIEKVQASGDASEEDNDDDVRISIV